MICAMNTFTERLKSIFCPSDAFGTHAGDYFLLRKVIMLNIFLIIGMFAFFFFALLHLFFIHNYFIAFIDFVSFVIFLCLYLDIKKNKNIKKAAIIGLFMLSFFMFSFVYFNHNNSFGLIWTIFVPIFAISQFKPKTGVRIALIYYLFLFSFLLYGVLYWNEQSWDITSFFRLFIASMILTFIYYATEQSFENLSKQLKKLTYFDALTALFNRRKIDEIMQEKFHEHQRYGTSLSIAILDIDDFKILNDTYGHSIGDTVLKEFSSLLSQSSRKTDAVGRWGGEEFMIIMPNTSLEQAHLNMQRFMSTLASHDFMHVNTLTCSVGICQADATNGTIDKLFLCADNALYYAKRNGKNQITSN